MPTTWYQVREENEEMIVRFSPKGDVPDWDEFCAKLYEVLWRNPEGCDSYKLTHHLAEKHKISVQEVARQEGFLSFEELLHSDRLYDVLNIEKKRPESDQLDFYVNYVYRPNLETIKYSEIRKRCRRMHKDFNLEIMIPIYRADAKAREEAEKEAAEALVKGGQQKARRVKTVVGELIEYDKDVGSSEDLGDEEILDEMTNLGMQDGEVDGGLDDEGDFDNEEAFEQGGKK